MKIKLIIGVPLSIAFIIVPQLTYCQKPDLLKTIFFENYVLRKIEDIDTIKQIEQKIAFINNKSNQKNGKLFFFNYSRRWKLLFSVQNGYHENFPGQYKDTTSFPQFQRLGNKSYLTPRNAAVALSGFKLFKIFGVS